MIELLIRAQIPEWAEEIDYSSLRRLPAELVDDKLQRRYADKIWRGRSSDAKTDYVLLLEFQGRTERQMALRTTVYTGLAVQELLRDDRDLGRGERDLAVACLVLHHGDRPWNAPTRLRDLFRDSAPDTYRVVSPRPLEAPPPTPLDLPRMVLAMVGLSTAPRMRDELAALRQVVEQCEDEDFDRFLTRAVTAMLRSKGMSSEQLEEAMTMGTVATAFQRSLDEIRQEGREQGIELGRELGQVSVLSQLTARKFGPAVAEELVRMLEHTPGPEPIARATAALFDSHAADEFLDRVRHA